MFSSTLSRAAFIIRFWKEPGSPSGWRSEVVEGTGEVVKYFDDFDDLVTYLQRYLEERGFSVAGQTTRR